MFHFHDHADVIYADEIPPAMQYAFARNGEKFDEVIRPGSDIAGTESDSIGHTIYARTIPYFWKPFEDWTVD